MSDWFNAVDDGVELLRASSNGDRRVSFPGRCFDPQTKISRTIDVDINRKDSLRIAPGHGAVALSPVAAGGGSCSEGVAGHRHNPVGCLAGTGPLQDDEEQDCSGHVMQS